MSESFKKNEQVAPKINPDKVLERIHVLRGTFSAMGRNNDEFPRLREIEAAIHNGSMDPEVAMKELNSIKVEKFRGDYN